MNLPICDLTALEPKQLRAPISVGPRPPLRPVLRFVLFALRVYVLVGIGLVAVAFLRGLR